MTVVRVKGIKRYRRRGKWYCYHRATNTRLKSEFGTGEFFAELASLERKVHRTKAAPGTLGLLLASYRQSPNYCDLAAATRGGYARIMDLLKPLHEMPVVEMTPAFLAGLRDKVGGKHGRRQANYVLAVLSVACEHGREHGFLRDNPVKGIKRLRRDRQLERANRPWSAAERQAVLENVPEQLKIPIALAMFTGLRKGDVLRLLKSAVRDGRIWRRTAKTGYELSIPIHRDLLRFLEPAAKHDAVTLAVTTKGTPWTESGFNATFIKTMRSLERAGKVEAGLTFHGLRHTVGTLLVEPDSISILCGVGSAKRRSPWPFIIRKRRTRQTVWPTSSRASIRSARRAKRN
ncbi:MAG: tyrosine-type recombinase/integrase [Methylovirgula sp.]|uniref:tyrosine-type recombinase/integrase n=1 Tax=Methylovirgula sp. TaxID=1978224 RepID=UPI003075F069